MSNYQVVWVKGPPDGPYGSLYSGDDMDLGEALNRWRLEGWELVSFHDEFPAGPEKPARQVAIFHRVSTPKKVAPVDLKELSATLHAGINCCTVSETFCAKSHADLDAILDELQQARETLGDSLVLPRGQHTVLEEMMSDEIATLKEKLEAAEQEKKELAAKVQNLQTRVMILEGPTLS